MLSRQLTRMQMRTRSLGREGYYQVPPAPHRLANKPKKELLELQYTLSTRLANMSIHTKNDADDFEESSSLLARVDAALKTINFDPLTYDWCFDDEHGDDPECRVHDL